MRTRIKRKYKQGISCLSLNIGFFFNYYFNENQVSLYIAASTYDKKILYYEVTYLDTLPHSQDELLAVVPQSYLMFLSILFIL